MANCFAWPHGFPIQFGIGHRTVRVRAGGQSAEIDEAIAPLIRAMWARNIKTVQSCQWQWGNANPNAPVWVLFASATDAERFLRLAKVKQIDKGKAVPSIGGTARSWRIFIRRLWLPTMRLHVSFLMPQRDVPEVIRNLTVRKRSRT